MQSLTSHRQFLTSLVETLTSIPQPVDSNPDRDHEPCNIPRDSRQLLLTLHVLFPSLLLPALDLLDRRLVTCFRIPGDPEGTEPDEALSRIYVVRSLGATLNRRTRDTASSLRKYLVRLSAWNCSCANFALDMFPLAATQPVESCEDTKAHSRSFGGMGRDGLTGACADVPCCKHLLACLLAERWASVLGHYVEERGVSKEQLAGLVAGM